MARPPAHRDRPHRRGHSFSCPRLGPSLLDHVWQNPLHGRCRGSPCLYRMARLLEPHWIQMVNITVTSRSSLCNCHYTIPNRRSWNDCFLTNNQLPGSFSSPDVCMYTSCTCSGSGCLQDPLKVRHKDSNQTLKNGELVYPSVKSQPINRPFGSGNSFRKLNISPRPRINFVYTFRERVFAVIPADPGHPVR